ncbi:MAG TPA: ABC transporter ATP-binding protein [Kiritimatiellia bacterium]|nr:ABC transporter ATP-binding protein [Kiritimatiellia bacterium]
MSDNLLCAENIVLNYPGLSRPAIDGVSMAVTPGRTLGIVGESGSGKSSLARCLLGLESLSSGRVLFEGNDIRHFNAAAMLQYRKKVQMVFQDPYNSLNPRMTVGEILGEMLRYHRMADTGNVKPEVEALLISVGLSGNLFDRYPHELSGGQRQRVGIARALSLKPLVVIADEPVSALDVSIQAQLLNLLKKMVTETGITLIMIAHDLAVVRYVCVDVMVMKDGVVVESGTVENVIDQPRHAYTKSLLAAVPDIENPEAFLAGKQ